MPILGGLAHIHMLGHRAGNRDFAPLFTYQTGTWATLRSVSDSNRNGDNAGARAMINPAGTVNVGSNATAWKNRSGATVAFLANTLYRERCPT